VRWTNPGKIKPCGHDAMITDESFTCSKRTCPYPYKSNGSVWSKRDADDMEDWIENLGKEDKVKDALRNGNRELLIQLLWTEQLQR
jgi:hypothetical protein